jgi:hypothetical protein
MLHKCLALALLGLCLVSCSLISSSGTAQASTNVLRSHLLTVRELPKGWELNSLPPTVAACTMVMPASMLVAPGGVAVGFDQHANGSLLVEYLAKIQDKYSLMEHALSQLTGRSCSESSNGITTNTSKDEGIMPVPLYGDWSVGTWVENFTSGTRWNLGYILIRKNHCLLVVAYENKGKLNLRALERFSVQALTKLTT